MSEVGIGYKKPSNFKPLKALFIMSLGFFAAGVVLTQGIAHHYHYASWLEGRVYGNVFWPWAGFRWIRSPAFTFDISTIPYLVASIGAAVFGLVGGMAMTGGLSRQKTRTTHGTSRWAERADIVEAGLLDGNNKPTSLIVGGFKTNRRVEFLAHNGPESVLAYAPSRSGKGVSLVIPNLLAYESSVFVLDVKGELWDATAGWRSKMCGNHVLYHDPCSGDPGNSKFNPLDAIRVGTGYEIKDAQNVVEYLVTERRENGSSGSDHWVKSARTLVTGVSLFCLHEAWNKGEPVGPGDILATLSDPERDPRQLFEDMMNNRLGPAGGVHSAIASFGAEMQAKEARELSGIISTAVTSLAIFRDPILAEATSRSDFTISDLVSNERPVTLYLIIRPSDRDRLNDYFALIVNLLCRRLTEVLPNAENNRHELLLMLDEFSSLPPIPAVQQSLDIFAGYRIKAFIVMQDYQRLVKLYGREETISSNCKVRIAYPPNRHETAEYLSKQTGTTTVLEEFRNTSGKRFAPIASGVSKNQSLYSRPLLTADEVTRLPVPKLDENDRMIEAGASLVFCRGCFPILGIQTPFFFDKTLNERAKHPAPVMSDELH
ncbi:MAG: type IV secretory system conjugative DNA transfer family protein [Gammaproteobacteria bacterium]|nr:type IV secretory system conjugative DNA transfer family protein [Gammaproteobacteria bacterium]